jgi:uncharacterized membrane protein
VGDFIFAIPVSIWWVIAAWPLIVGAILFFYRKEWSFTSLKNVLPAVIIRVVVVTLLLLCLLQPVWKTEFSKTIPLTVPIFIDNSASMWYPDRHRKAADKVELSERLELLDPKLRFKFERFFKGQLPDAHEALEAVGAEKLTFKAKPENEEVDAIEDRYDEFIDLAEEFEDMLERFEDEDADLALLDSVTKGSAAEAMRAVSSRGEALEKAWEKVEDKEVQTGSDYARIAREIELGRSDADEFLLSISAYQERADEELAESDDPRVQPAIERVTESSRMDLLFHVMEDIKAPIRPELEDRNEKSPIYIFGEEEALDKEKHFKLEHLQKAKIRKTDIPAEFTRLFSNLPDEEEMEQVILITDGRDNSASAEGELIDVFKKKNLRVITLATGIPEPAPDVGILNSELPARAFDGDTVPLKMKMKMVGEHDGDIKIRVMSGDEIIEEQDVPKDVERDELGRFDFKMEFKVEGSKPPQRVELLSDDTIPENNERPLDMWVRKEQIRVLFMDEFPRWESRYLNMMLRRDKRMDLRKMRTIFTASLKDRKLKRGDGAREFPADEESLYDFDLIILGDLPPETFTREEMDRLVSFVRDRSGTIIFLAGPNFLPGSWQNTPLEDLLPAQPSRRISIQHAALKMSLTDEGKEADFIRPYKGPVNPAGHGRLHWTRNDIAETPTAAVLAQDSNTGLPIVITSLYGTGKTLFLASDEFWRWRYRSGWTFHHAYWSMILLWATSEKIEGVSKYAKLHMDKLKLTTSENAEVKIRLMDDEGKPLESSLGFIHLESIGESDGEEEDAPGGDAQPETEVKESEEETDSERIDKKIPYQVVDVGGRYRIELGELPAGRYRIKPIVTELEGVEMEAKLEFEVVEETTMENLYIRQNRSFLERLSEETGGKFFDFPDYAKLPEAVTTDEKEVKREESNELWDTWWMLAAVVGLLVVEWVFRKRRNLV